MAKIEVACPTCGKIRKLSKRDAARAKQCRTCHLKAIAPLGYAATAAKHGRYVAIEKAAEWRKANPSSLEQMIEAALSAIDGIVWQRERAIERINAAPYFVDFAIFTPAGSTALEVDGTWVHRNDDMAITNNRLDIIAEHFDRVIVIAECDLRSHEANLTGYIERLIEVS